MKEEESLLTFVFTTLKLGEIPLPSYFSEDKENYEGRGISPNFRVVNTKADILNQVDPVIQKALNYLKEKNNH